MVGDCQTPGPFSGPGTRTTVISVLRCNDRPFNPENSMRWSSRRDGNCAVGCLALLILAAVIGSFLPDPDGGVSTSHRTGGTGNPTATPSPSEMAIQSASLKVNRWWKDGFDVVMMLDVSITNGDSNPIKDIEISCEHLAPSGTKIDRNTTTIYERIPAGATRRFREVNMGFIHEQAKSTRCTVTDLVVQ